MYRLITCAINKPLRTLYEYGERSRLSVIIMFNFDMIIVISTGYKPFYKFWENVYDPYLYSFKVTRLWYWSNFLWCNPSIRFYNLNRKVLNNFFLISMNLICLKATIFIDRQKKVLALLNILELRTVSTGFLITVIFTGGFVDNS